MDRKVINSPDELIDLALSPEFETIEFSRLEFGDGFNVRFKLVGDQWDGQIDYVIGHYIVKLQKDILGIYSNLTGQRVTLRGPAEELRNLRVTATVEDGSTELYLELARTFLEFLRMSPEYVALMGISAIAAYYRMLRYREKNRHEEKMEQLEIEKQKAKNELTLNNIIQEGVKTGQQIAEKYISAPKHIAFKMNNDDRILFPDSYQITKTQAIKALPSAIDVDDDSVYWTAWVDDVFRVIAQNYDKGIIAIESPDGQPIEVKLNRITPESKKPLQNQIAEKFALGEIINLRLRIGIDLNNQQEIIGAFVIQVDPKPDPENYRPMAEALNSINSQFTRSKIL